MRWPCVGSRISAIDLSEALEHSAGGTAGGGASVDAIHGRQMSPVLRALHVPSIS